FRRVLFRSGLRLKHDHRHEDGTPDATTMYGGDTRDAGSVQRQSFPVDAESVALFQREGLSASLDNTWAMELEAGKRFVYELSRPGGRMFQVEFDLTTPVALPPAPWDSEPGTTTSVMSEEGRRWRPSLFFHPIGWRLRSAVAEAGAATVVDPQAVAAVPPIAAFDAGGLGQLLDQHRAACTTVPGAGAHTVVFAAAGDGVVVDLTLAVAPAMAACFGELGATAVVDPHRAIAAAPVPARDSVALRQPLSQRGAPPGGVADARAVG